MTPRERLFASLEGRPTDCVPIWLLFPYHPIGCYVDVRTHPRYRPIHEASMDRAVILNRRSLPTTSFAPEVTARSETFTDNGVRITRKTLEHAGQKLTSEQRSSKEETQIRKFLNSEEDLETYASFPANTDPARIHAELEAQMPRYLKEREEFPERCGAMMLDLGEPIGMLYRNANLEEYAIWSLTSNDTVLRILNAQMERLRVVYRYCLEHDLADVYFLVGSELASPPLVSVKTFQEWIVPFARELIEMIHSYGKKAIQHYHGQIKRVLPDFVTMGADGLHTIEAPPNGNCTLTEAFEIVDDRITLIGNIQYDLFRSNTPAEMREAVQDVLEECAGKRFILSPSAGPYEEDLSDAFQANYFEFLKAGAGC